MNSSRRVATATPSPQGTRSIWVWSVRVVLVVLWGLSLAQCDGSETHWDRHVGSETHFLRICPDNGCGNKDQCLCNVCTVACDDLAACRNRLPNVSNLVCRAPACGIGGPDEQLPNAPAICDVTCKVDADCHVVSAGHLCTDGYCRTTAPLSSEADSGGVPGLTCPEGMKAVPAGSLIPTGETETFEFSGFCLDQFEVTVATYKSCFEAGTCPTKPTQGNYLTTGREQHPLQFVSYEQAKTFCEAAGKRLPQRAEWEWAARNANAATPYPWGKSAPSSADAPARVCALTTSTTCAAGSFAAGNGSFGHADLSGNVAEIVETSTAPCVAGGSFSVTESATSSSELSASACVPYTSPAQNIGFRCAK